jgi:energy-coupling factor transporter ATP-binding protein EcfA2
MITHLHLKNGSPGQSLLTVGTGSSVTIFVGPNNAGKSQALREINGFCQSGQLNSAYKIVERLTFADVDPSIVQAEFNTVKVTPNLSESVNPGHSLIQMPTNRFMVNDDQYKNARAFPNRNVTYYTQQYLTYYILNLDGPGRIGLVNGQRRGDLKNPSTPLARLLTNDPKRTALRKIIYDSIGLYFAIDAQSGDQLNIRFGDTSPPDERSFNDQAIDYMRSARDINAVSDGVKAYTGILLQVHTGDPKIILIDEPEAFLHPSLAFRLGKELAKGAATEGKDIFAATHSPQFVMGAILSGAKVDIIRLTYDGSVGTARLLPSSDLTKLMQNPLLRSVGMLSGLFYSYVVVSEADADRAFYQEINERLLAADDARAIPHALFLNADNKQTIPRIIEPLRKLGIPAAGIADIDIVKDGGARMDEPSQSLQCPDFGSSTLWHPPRQCSHCSHKQMRRLQN